MIRRVAPQELIMGISTCLSSLSFVLFCFILLKKKKSTKTGIKSEKENDGQNILFVLFNVKFPFACDVGTS